MINCKNIIKKYQDLTILDDINLDIEIGDTVAITAPSGAGKSTLLNIIAGLDNYNSGEIIINNTNISTLNNNQLVEFRLNNIGFIFQFHHLLPDFNLLENIAMPLLIRGENKQIAYDKAYDLLQSINLADKAKNFISELSGGQRQRGAILRAVINNPKVILADEPTGNLDNENTNLVIELLINLCKENNTTLLMATHNNDIAKKMGITYNLANKQLIRL